MKRTNSILTGIAAVVFIAAAAVAGAQTFGGPGYGYGMGLGMGPGMGAGMGHGMGPGMGRGPLAAGDVSAYIDARLADIKSRLNVTSSQESAWQAYAAQFKQQAQQMQALRAQMWNDSASAPDRMTVHAQAMEQRAASMTAMSDA